MKQAYKYLFCLFIILPSYGSISIVYNLRVAQTTKRIIIDPLFPKPSLGTITPFGTFREKYNGVKHHCGGGLFTLIYSPHSFFLRVDAAVARVSSFDNGVYFKRTQADDLLFSGGYSPHISDKMRITFSGLLGFPTHKDTSLEFVQFGYGHYGLGGQIDGSFIYSSNRDHTIRCAARLIHFFPRTIAIPIENQFELFKYNNGNLADLFIAFHSKIGFHSIETGYDASFFFNAAIHPHYDDAVKKTNYIRNSFYGIYKYRYVIHDVAQMLALALSYGFDSKPKIYGNKRIITIWGSWTVNF